jgi:hypothetical protein
MNQRSVRHGSMKDAPVQNLLSSRLLSKNIKIRIQNYNFICDSVWVRNLVSDIKGGT